MAVQKRARGSCADFVTMHLDAQIVMIGDGITDLEAVQVSGGADLFIG